MTTNIARNLRALAAVVCLAAVAPVTQAATYDFSQSFGAFGTVSGQFSGVDTVGSEDGILSWTDNEVTVESLNFIGNLGNLSFGAADISVLGFQWVIADLGSVTNPSTGFDLYADNGSGISLNWASGDYVGFDSMTNAFGAATLADAASSTPAITLDATAAAVVANSVSPVPEPESYLMMAMGLVAIAAAKRGRRQQA